MEYKKASEIRNKGLLALIAENKFRKEKSLGEAIGSAISDKFKAKAVGIKEKFDPLNIVRGITGKGTFGKIATTLVGRALGKSERDIGYFGGYTRKPKQQIVGTNITPIEHQEQEGQVTKGPIIDVLKQMYEFMQKTHEVDKKDYEIQQAFLEEQSADAEIKHKELVRAIKKYVKVPKDASKTENDGGIFNSIFKMLEDFKDKVNAMFEPFKKFMESFGKDVLQSILSFGGFLIRNPLAMSALLWSIGLYKAKEFLDETNYGERVSKEGEAKLAQKALREKKTDFSHMPLDKEQAKAILEQPETPGKKRDIESFGGLERIQAIADGKPDPGGVSLQKPVDNNTPTNQTKEFKERKDKVQKVKSSELVNQQTDNSNKENTVNNQSSMPVVSESTSATVSKNTESSIPTPLPKSTPIPEQTSAEGTESTPIQPVIAVNNSTKNIGGSNPKMFNLDTIKVRNDDLNRYLRRSSVVV